MPSSVLFACLLAWFAAGSVHAAYDPSLIVATLESCPIPIAQYPPSVFSTDTLVTVFAPLAQQIPRQECAEQSLSLAVCAFDGSLGVETGCCTSACSAAMSQLNSLNCWPDILATLCKASPEQEAQVQALIPILAGAAERCANYIAPPSITCPDGRILSTVRGSAGVGGAGTPAAEGPMPELGAMPQPADMSPGPSDLALPANVSPGPSDLALPGVGASPAP